MTRRRRGWTLRLAGRVWRITIPSRRVRFGRDGYSRSLGWLIVTRLDRTGL